MAQLFFYVIRTDFAYLMFNDSINPIEFWNYICVVGVMISKGGTNNKYNIYCYAWGI